MRRASADGRGRAAACVLLTIAAVGLVAYLAVMTGFATYDDEGYFLVSLRGYNHGTALFQEIYTQYGPFYWQLVGGIFAVGGITIDHDSGRIVTMLMWCGAAGFSAAAVWRLTRSVLLGCGVAALVMRALYLYPGEPLHPGAPIALFLAALTFAFTFSSRTSFALAGVLVAALLLMKINVGCFALLAVLLLMPGGVPRSALGIRWRRLIVCAFCIGPLVLMLPKIGASGYLPYALHIALCATAFVIVLEAFPLEAPDVRGRSQLWLLGALTGFVVVDVLLTWVTSSSLSSIWDGVVRDAISQPDVFASPPRILSSALVLDVLSVGLAALVAAQRDTFGAFLQSRRGTLVIGSLRLAGGSLTWLAMSTMNAPLALPVTAMWLAAVPSTLDEGRRRWAIRAIAAVALLQTLHAYPVADSQKGWASFMLILVAGVLISDGAREIGSVLAEPLGRGVVQGIAGVAAAQALLVAFLLALPTYLHDFRSTRSLDLPGARLVHADPQTVTELRAVTAAIADRCGTFLPMPGLDSFYIFARKTPPTLLTTSGWMLRVSDAQQARAVREVEAVKDVCILRSDSILSFWLAGQPLPNRPLVAYVESHSKSSIPLPGGYNLTPPP